MAYNGTSERYAQAQYQARPQVYSEQNGHGHHQQLPVAHVYQARDDQGYNKYQQETFSRNQQYAQNYAPAWEQDQGQTQHHVSSNDRPPIAGAQQRSYQYDDRFRNNGRQEPQYDNRGGGPGRATSPQPRPSTSASSRRMKQERILDSELDSPKAMGWDNPFGVFPGTKKDAEQKKKSVEEARSRSRAETPSDRSGLATSSSRPTTSASVRDVNTTTNQPWSEGRPQTSQSGRNPSLENNTSFVNHYNQSDNMPLRKKRIPPENGPGYDAFEPPSQSVRGDKQTSKLSLPVRSAPSGFAAGTTVDQQTSSPPAGNAAYDSRSGAMYGQEQYSNGDSQNFFRRKKQNNDQYGVNPDQYDPNQHYQHQEDAQLQPDNGEYSQSDEKGRLVNRPGETQAQANREYAGGNGDFEYRGVKTSKSMTDLNDSSVPNFDAMPANAAQNVERQVNMQPQQPPTVYRKPTYGDASSRVPVRPGLVVDQDHASSNQYGPGAQSPQEYSMAPPGQEIRGDQQSPPMQQNNRGDYGQQQFPPRNGSRQEARVRGPPAGFRHPYNQPNQGRVPAQYPRSPPRGSMPGQQVRSPGRRAPRQDYGFDDQGYPSGNRYDPNPYYENPAYVPYPREQARSQDQPPALIRSQTEPTSQPYEEQYDQSYSRRGPPSRKQTYDSGYDQQFPNPAQARKPKQYEQGRAHDPNRFPAPTRPRTANPAGGPPNPYQDQGMPRQRTPNPNSLVASRNHPMPVRPGLMSPPPPAPAPLPMPARTPAPPTPAPIAQAPAPRTQQSATPQVRASNTQTQNAPVTTRELSELRDAFNKTPGDDKLGLKFAKKLAEAGSVLANEGGRADPKQTAKNREKYVNDAYKVVKKLISNGSSEAMFYLADCYGVGKLGLETNPKEAFLLYTSAAKMNHPQAAYRVAVCCELGMDGGGGARRDYVKAVQFYKKAATLGDAPAMFKMGAILMKGLLGQQANRREGIQWLKRAAERADAENPHALHELGQLYEVAKPDDVIIKDERYALELFTRAANLGYKHSQSRLGAAYEYGLMGVPIDPQSSIMWYSKAASQGEHLAEFALSGWYLTGAPPLLEQSDQEAYLWARKAASAGLAKAEYAMGYYTETGIGATPNVEEAKKWYFRAAAQNDERARSRLEEFKRGAGRKERSRVTRNGVGRQNEGDCTVM